MLNVMGVQQNKHGGIENAKSEKLWVSLAHSLLPVLERLAAFGFGCLALYIAIFMYKSEREQWQNRLETIWIGIDERAKKTDAVFTAIVNKVPLS